MLAIARNLEPSSSLSKKIVAAKLLKIPALDNLGDTLTKAISYATSLTIPRLKLGLKSKSWWNEELSTKRQELKRKARLLSFPSTQEEKQEYLETRKTFVNAIKQAKR